MNLTWPPKLPRIRLRLTKPRPTVIALELWGLYTIIRCCMTLGVSEDVLPIGAAWVGGILIRMMDILKDDEDEVPTLRLTILVGAVASGILMIFLCQQYAAHVSLMVPVMTAYAAGYGAVIAKIINNENALADAMKGGGSGCRYPGKD